MQETKKISLFSATCFSIATMIGSGWLFSSQLAAKYAGNYAFLAWAIAGIIIVLVGMCFSFVAFAFPVTGATTRSSALSHNKTFGLPFAFANWFGIAVIVANEAQATGEYIFGMYKTHLFMSGQNLTIYGKLVEMGLVSIYLLINFFGIKLLARVNNLITVFKIIMPIATIIFFLSIRFNPGNFHLHLHHLSYAPSSVIDALVGAGMIYSLNGFQTVMSFAGEVKNPKRNVPLALMLATIIVTLLYMGLQLSFMGAVPHEQLHNGWSGLNFASPLFNIAMLLNLHFLAACLIADSMISPSGTGCTYLGAASRMLFAMAKEGQVPLWLAKIAPEDVLSKRSIIFNFILALIVLSNGGTWALLMVIVSGCNIIGYMAAPISMGAIKPSMRPFGLIVFAIITLLMATITADDLFKIAVVMTLVMIIYLLVQYNNNTWQKIVYLVVPFLLYMWALYFVQNKIAITLIGVGFYLLVTHKKYVAYCVRERKNEMSEMFHDIEVDSSFDGGSIEIVDIKNPGNLRFKLRSDTNSHFAQWFYFKLANIAYLDLEIKITELKHSAYPLAWKDYNAVMSYDNKAWTRIKSEFDGDNLTFAIKPSKDVIYFAYFEPYSYLKHMQLIDSLSKYPMISQQVISKSTEGRDVSLLKMGNPASVNKIWVIARQHPGETMAEWFMEGLIRRLVETKDPISASLLQNCELYLIPNMNPDGSIHGNLRVNAKGKNLNREWLNPTIEGSPEVYYVRQKMLETGVTMFFDIHGDEDIPYVFTDSCAGNPSFSEKQANLLKLFQHYFRLISPDYQTEHGYGLNQFGDESQMIASNWVGNQFDCLSIVLEMPFKDNNNYPDKVTGWDGKRSSLLGQSLLTVINCLLHEAKLLN